MKEVTVETLSEAVARAKRMALGDVYGLTEHPFTAVEYRKTLPVEWQAEVESVIVDIYHNT